MRSSVTASAYALRPRTGITASPADSTNVAFVTERPPIIELPPPQAAVATPTRVAVVVLTAMAQPCCTCSTNSGLMTTSVGECVEVSERPPLQNTFASTNPRTDNRRGRRSTFSSVAITMPCAANVSSPVSDVDSEPVTFTTAVPANVSCSSCATRLPETSTLPVPAPESGDSEASS